MQIVKFLLLLLIGLSLLVAAAFATLYVSDPRLPVRYLQLFIPEDGNFSGLEPRERVSVDEPWELPVAAADDRTIQPNALATMVRYAEEQDSYSLIVIHEGVIQAEWYADGWDRSRLTQSQSMHKSVLPILVGAAIDDGSIGSVEDAVGLYIKEWADDPRGDISIEQLMTMSSGLVVYPFSLNPFNDAFRWLFASRMTPVLLRTPLVKEPGSVFEYNNLNSELLGLIIERATGKRYAEYLQSKLWEPMGAAGAELWLDREGGKAHSSCCLLAPTMDWARFGMLLLGRGSINDKTIVSEEYFDGMISPSPNSDWYGYQIWLGYSRELNPRAVVLAGGYQRTDPFDREDSFYASGFGAQRVYVVPSAELVIVRMGPASGRFPVRESWDNTFLVNTALRNRIGD